MKKNDFLLGLQHRRIYAILRNTNRTFNFRIMNKQLGVTKILNGLLITIIVILILMSILAIIVIHMTFFDKVKYIFSFSPDGINNYLNALGEYKALFTATVATIAAYFGLWRYKAATDQNRDKLKQDRFVEWRTVLDIRAIEIEKPDPDLNREFTRVRYNLFNQLHDLNFNITNNEQLTIIFQTTFQDLVGFFEDQNNRNIGMGGSHPNNTHSYSYMSFQYLFLGSLDASYPDIVTDLQTLYIANLPANRIIDHAIYQVALIAYRPYP